MRKRLTTKLLRLISIGLYIGALTQVCYDTERGAGEAGEGAALVISGFFGFFSSGPGLIWLANPALWISWIFMGKRRTLTLSMSLISVILSLLFLNVSEITVDEGGGQSNITGYHIGYWLWVSSISVMFLTNACLYFFGKNIEDEIKTDNGIGWPPIK